MLLSSHLLHEVQATADHLVVISEGAVVASGLLNDLLASSTMIVRAPDPDELVAALRGAGIGHVANADRSFTIDVLGGRVTPEMVALDRQVLLTELRASDSQGLGYRPDVLQLPRVRPPCPEHPLAGVVDPDA